MSTYVEDLFSLAGRTALVTGASSGIGRQMALALASAGANVVLVARREDRLADVAGAISDGGGGAHELPADLGQRDEVARVAAAALEPFDAPDILVNAAGVNPRQPADQVSWDTWDATLHLNLSVPFFLARELIAGMQRKGGGNIINIASLQSFRGVCRLRPLWRIEKRHRAADPSYGGSLVGRCHRRQRHGARFFPIRIDRGDI